MSLFKHHFTKWKEKEHYDPFNVFLRGCYLKLCSEKKDMTADGSEILHQLICTPPKFNTAPEKWWLEDEFPFGIAYF